MLGSVLSSADFLSKLSFSKIFLGIPPELSVSWDILSGLILFLTVCKVYQQTTLVHKELK